MPLTIDMAIAKTNKYASRESGDTVEIVERPGGGMSVIMADGQGSGRAAKSLSMLVTAKVAALLKEGVRDGASARAANDFLFAMRHGQVSATLDILSVDLKTGTVVITRNSETACLVKSDDGTEVLSGAERPLGIHPRTRPWAAEIPVGPALRVILISDGIANSGSRNELPSFDTGSDLGEGRRRCIGRRDRRSRARGGDRPGRGQTRRRHECRGTDLAGACGNNPRAADARRGAIAVTVREHGHRIPSQ